MAKQLVFLRYNFIFNPAETWSHLHQFEDALAKFFEGHNMQARIVRTVEGQIGDRLMIIEKKEEVKRPVPPKKSSGIKRPQTKRKRIRKGGKPLPKTKDKPRRFSFKKGKRLSQKPNLQ